MRSVWYFDTFHSPGEWLRSAPEMSLPLLTAWTLAVGGLRLLPPRPPLRRLASQPGAAACGAVALVFTIGSLRYALNRIAEAHGISWRGLPAHLIVAEWYGNVISDDPYPYAIAAVWGLLLVGRRCRPEPSWVDRAGRLLGLSRLLLSLWFTLDYAIDEWRGSGM